MVKSTALEKMKIFLNKGNNIEVKDEKYSIVEFADSENAMKFYYKMHSSENFMLDVQFVKRKEEMRCVMV